MNTKDIRNAMKSTLDAGSLGVTTTWANVDQGAGARPRVEFSVPDAEQTGGTLKGNEIKREEGTALAVVVTKQGQGENEALDLADGVAALFPEGSRIAISGGEITIMARPSIRGGYSDDADYRVPVAIRYRATATT